MLLTNFEEMIPDRHKLLPERHVGPEGLGEEGDDGGEAEHFPHGKDELLGFLGHDLVHAAHTSLKQHGADPCVQTHGCYTETAQLLWDTTGELIKTCTEHMHDGQKYVDTSTWHPEDIIMLELLSTVKHHCSIKISLR